MEEHLQTETGGEAGRILQMEAIVAEHETMLLRYAARITHNPATAQDVVQNVFIKLFRGWQSGAHPTERLKSWLYKVTHNEAVDHIRHESRLQQLHEREAAGRDECVDGQHCPSPADERHAQVLAAVRKLAAGEQQVVLLRLEQGLSYEEISQITGRSIGNVGNILHHAVKKVAAQLKKAGVVS